MFNSYPRNQLAKVMMSINPKKKKYNQKNNRQNLLLKPVRALRNLQKKMKEMNYLMWKINKNKVMMKTKKYQK